MQGGFVVFDAASVEPSSESAKGVLKESNPQVGHLEWCSAGT